MDSIKGSEVMYPIVLKTRARKQFAAVREIQRRIRLALEEKNLLPGSPLPHPQRALWLTTTGSLTQRRASDGDKGS